MNREVKLDPDHLQPTSSLRHSVLQYLLHPGCHVRDILGNGLDSLHQAGWLKPAHTITHKHSEEETKLEVGGTDTLLSHIVNSSAPHVAVQTLIFSFILNLIQEKKKSLLLSAVSLYVRRSGIADDVNIHMTTKRADVAPCSGFKVHKSYCCNVSKVLFR